MSHNRVQKAILPDGRRCFHCKMLSFLFLPYKIGLSENQGYVLMSGFPEDIMTYNKGIASHRKDVVQVQSQTVTLGINRNATKIAMDFSTLSFLINIPPF